MTAIKMALSHHFLICPDKAIAISFEHDYQQQDRIIFVFGATVFLRPCDGHGASRQLSRCACGRVHGRTVELAALLSHGADQNCRDELRQTPLITATQGASLGIVEMLLRQGVIVNSRDEIGETALSKARQKLAFFDMKGGENYRQLYREMIHLLVQSGAIE